MKICLVYASENPFGGWATYTRHLHDGLVLAGHDVTLRKFRDKPSSTRRKFGYGLTYRPSSVETVLTGGYDAILVVAVQKNFSAQVRELLEYENTYMVIHDGNECKHVSVEDLANRVIVIREANLGLAPGSVFIPHPYIRSEVPHPKTRRLAVSVSRIDHDKNTTILLDANRLLSDDKKITIRGFENRIYTRFRVMPHYPEWVQSKGTFPREKDAAVKILVNHKYMTDMSIIKGDGGGSQYTFLEAIDAGAVCILHDEWLSKPGEFKKDVNCLGVSTPEELAKILKSFPESRRREIAEEATKLLRPHAWENVIPQYIQFFSEGRAS